MISDISGSGEHHRAGWILPELRSVLHFRTGVPGVATRPVYW